VLVGFCCGRFLRSEWSAFGTPRSRGLWDVTGLLDPAEKTDADFYGRNIKAQTLGARRWGG